MYDYKSDDMSSNYKSQHSSAVNTGSEPIDYNRQIREHSRCCASKKSSSVTDSSSSSFDSGKSLPCESVPSYSKVTRWLEYTRMLEEEREKHACRQISSTSPVVCQSRKSNKESLSLTNNPPSNDFTVIGYSYGRHAVPYLVKMRGKNITLRQFKSILSKKGNFRYFFKTACNDFGTGVIFEEVTENSKVLPLWEGKVFCFIETMDGDNTIM